MTGPRSPPPLPQSSSLVENVAHRGRGGTQRFLAPGPLSSVPASPRHQENWKGRGSRSSGGGAAQLAAWCPPVSAAEAELSAPAKQGEPELCGECKAQGERAPSPARRRRPQPQPNERRADNLFSNPGSGARRWRVAGAGGGVVASASLPLRRPPPPRPCGLPAAHTHIS